MHVARSIAHEAGKMNDGIRAIQDSPYGVALPSVAPYAGEARVSRQVSHGLSPKNEQIKAPHVEAFAQQLAAQHASQVSASPKNGDCPVVHEIFSSRWISSLICLRVRLRGLIVSASEAGSDLSGRVRVLMRRVGRVARALGLCETKRHLGCE